jgi:pSer/pThr/pTyr-binding forkhead associated (FHA) protein
MAECPFCGHSNMEGALVCAECGQIIESKDSDDHTRPIDFSTQKQSGILPPDRGTAVFPHAARLVLDFGKGDSQTVIIDNDDQITIGRVDRFTSVLPTINLNTRDGWNHGVSRRHVAVRRKDDTLYVIDLHSTNGTWLNGERIAPEEPTVLRDADKLRLGLLEFRVHFGEESAWQTDQAEMTG